MISGGIFFVASIGFFGYLFMKNSKLKGGKK